MYGEIRYRDQNQAWNFVNFFVKFGHWGINSFCSHPQVAVPWTAVFGSLTFAFTFMELHLLEAYWTLDSTYKSLLCPPAQPVRHRVQHKAFTANNPKRVLMISASSLSSPCSCYSLPSVIQQWGRWTAQQPLEKGHSNLLLHSKEH